MRTKQLSDREKEINGRLHEARKLVGLSQLRVAEELGVQRCTPQNWELNRTPVRCDMALRFCRQLIISEQWLATGAGWPRHCMDLLTEPLARPLAQRPFGKAYDEILGARYRELSAANPSPRILFNETDGEQAVVRLLTAVNERHLTQLCERAMEGAEGLDAEQRRGVVLKAYVEFVSTSASQAYRTIERLPQGFKSPSRTEPI